MKFSFGSKSKSKEKQTILFVCIQNAGRSQMAEGFFRKYAPEGYYDYERNLLQYLFKYHCYRTITTIASYHGCKNFDYP